MKFLGGRKQEDVLKILGMINVSQKEENAIFQDGLKEKLNNTLDLNRLKQDVEL